MIQSDQLYARPSMWASPTPTPLLLLLLLGAGHTKKKRNDPHVEMEFSDPVIAQQLGDEEGPQGQKLEKNEYFKLKHYEVFRSGRWRLASDPNPLSPSSP